jgi:hypothetical protein
MRRRLLQGWYVNRGFRNIIYIQKDAKWWLEYHMFVAMGQCVDPQKASYALILSFSAMPQCPHQFTPIGLSQVLNQANYQGAAEKSH